MRDQAQGQDQEHADSARDDPRNERADPGERLHLRVLPVRHRQVPRKCCAHDTANHLNCHQQIRAWVGLSQVPWRRIAVGATQPQRGPRVWLPLLGCVPCRGQPHWVAPTIRSPLGDTSSGVLRLAARSSIYRLSSIVYRLSSIVYRLSSIVYRLSSIVYRLSSIVIVLIYRLSSIVYRLSSIVYRLSSIVYRL